MGKTSRYSLWARHIKNPRMNDGETVFDAVSRIAHGFVGKKVWRATVVRHFGHVVALEDEPVTMTGIAKIDMIGARNGNTGTLYPNVTFVGDTEKWAGVYFSADTIYETQLLIGKDSEVMCGGYGKALNEALTLVRHSAKSLIDYLNDYREIAQAFAGRGWERVWEDARHDSMVARLMPLADDEELGKEIAL
ncbi:MAG: hypothetical protein IIZ06_03605 [Kiritimatiellae bacterium]|nr:hypothetical protein [Kiritimatiellia bacterium]